MAEHCLEPLSGPLGVFKVFSIGLPKRPGDNMHPLSPDLSGLTDAELHKKQGELVARLTQAYRIGPYGIIGQLQMLMDDYNSEIQRRNAKVLEDMAKKGRDMGGIIDIK
jgi:hypothetical protein